VIKRAALLALFLLAPAAAHAADPIPAYILDKDYQNCIGNDAKDVNKINYCECVRTTMRKEWTLDDYGGMVMEQLKNPNQPTEQLQKLAKSCFDKVQPQ
jgi:hypothetical protein